MPVLLRKCACVLWVCVCVCACVHVCVTVFECECVSVNALCRCSRWSSCQPFSPSLSLCVTERLHASPCLIPPCSRVTVGTQTKPLHLTFSSASCSVTLPDLQMAASQAIMASTEEEEEEEDERPSPCSAVKERAEQSSAVTSIEANVCRASD